MISTFRHFCSSPHVLDVYTGDLSLTAGSHCHKIMQALQVSLRNENPHIPNHNHSQRVDYSFQQKNSLSHMLLRSLGVLSPLPSEGGHQDFLMVYHNNIYVKQELYDIWQHEVLSYMSPLPFLAASMEKHGYEQGERIEDSMNRLSRCLKQSTLPSVLDNRFERVVHTEDKGNLVDLHVHFNGSTEATQVWLHGLRKSSLHYQELKNAIDHPSCRDKMSIYYKEINSSPMEMFHFLNKAAIIRQFICRFLKKRFSPYKDKKNFNILHVISLLQTKSHAYRSHPQAYIFQSKHPFSHPALPPNCNDLQREGAMWLFALRHVRSGGQYLLAFLLHIYMLLGNAYMRILVQQQHQFGFDQFQNITLVGAREALEGEDFKSRFIQLQGMYGNDMAAMEMRFSPKNEVKKNIALLQKIWKGYKEVHFPLSQKEKREQKRQLLCYGKSLKKKPQSESYCDSKKTQLSLVVHFIKEAESKVGFYRHQRLRKSLQEKANTLTLTRNALSKIDKELYRALVGKDAASNELETPPEVFAPIFRYLNLQGLTNTSYHAGEDYNHIFSGIRAVHEAIYFLDMKSGDRIGHATALGISPKHCQLKETFCSQGEWLDNLIWITKLIAKRKELYNFSPWISRLLPDIQKIYITIYGKPCPELHVLWEAWKMRKLDISLARPFETYPILPHIRQEKKMISQARTECSSAYKEWILYHRYGYRRAWDKKIKIDDTMFDFELIMALQDTVISEMRQKNIIVEVLPTSNVRISHYHTTEDHHLVRWLSPEDTRPVPQVVLGSDDPGIFATNLRNEYAHILDLLHKKYPSSSEKPYDILVHLIENSHSYRFRMMESPSENTKSRDYVRHSLDSY